MTTITINSFTTAPLSLLTSDDLTLTGGGTVIVTGTKVAVHVHGTSAGHISNSGSIYDSTSGLLIDSGGNLLGGVSNLAGGVIHGGQAGINIISSSAISTGISNASTGTITGASGNGISISSSSHVNGGISNSGVIRGAGGEGISILSSNGSNAITNSAGGLIYGASDGIKLRNSTDTGALDNSGTIEGGNGILVCSGGGWSGQITNEATGTISGGSHGILVVSATLTHALDNKGLITGFGNAGIMVATGGVLSNGITNEANATISGGTGIKLSSGTITGNIANSGDISGSGANGFGILLGGGSTLSGSITNDLLIHGFKDGLVVTHSDIAGAISNTTAASTMSGLHYGMFISDSTIGGGINNDGKISGANTAGILLQSSAVVRGGITSSGTIIGFNHGIENAGSTITGGATGVHIKNSGSVSGGLYNTGTISGVTNGIKIDLHATLSGGINDSSSGLITGDVRGVYNLGHIVGATGLRVDHATLDGGILNSGVMNDTQRAIIINAGHVSGIIQNTGIMHGGGAGIWIAQSALTTDITNQSTGTISSITTAIRLSSASTLTGTIDNHGLISAAHGIYIHSTNTLVGAIASDGTITGSTDGILNQGSILAGSTAAIKLYGSVGALSGGINNSGRIHGSTGISLQFAAHLSGGILNTGTISAPATGIYLASSAVINGGIENRGHISGFNGIYNGGTITGAVHVHSNGVIAGGIYNAGTITTGPYALWVDNNGTLADGVFNTGILHGGLDGIMIATANLTGGITNQSSGSISGGVSGYGIYNVGTLQGGITNHGHMASIYNGSVLQGGIFDDGTLGAIHNASIGTISGVTGISVSGVGITGGIDTSGTIIGTGGTAILMDNVTGDFDITINGGQIVGDVTDSQRSAGNSNVSINTDYRTEGDFSVSNLIVQPFHQFEISTGDKVTLNTMGTSTNGFFKLDVDGVAKDMLNVTGGAVNLAGGAVVSISVDSGAVLSNGKAIEIMTGTSGIQGIDPTTLTSCLSDSPLWHFNVEGGVAAVGGSDNDLYLIPTLATTGGFDGNSGNDTYNGTGTNNDVMEGSTGADTLNGNAGDDYLSGGAGADILNGGDGNDTLDGGAGIDKLAGGAGDDTYIVDLSGTTLLKLEDTITEVSGNDTVTLRNGNNLAPAGFTTLTIGTGIENMDASHTGSLKLDITGTTANNVITGNDAANVLKGMTGDDTLQGGLGNDTLDGGAGNDSMAGGLGNDTYFVDSSGDHILENAGEGNDTVVVTAATTVAQTLQLSDYANVENMTVTGTGVWNITGTAGDNALTGNGSVNTITGGGGNDTLDGGIGADSLIGGAGNDTYVIDNIGDRIDTVAETGGIDTIVDKMTSGTYVLGAAFENLALGGTTAALHGTGNSGDNTITGNGGANVIDGAGGNDLMIGGGGADTYFVDSTGDVVSETTAGTTGGLDLIISSVSYTLGTNVEKLTLATGAGNINGDGNSIANLIVGNAGDNSLDGHGGIDTLQGGLGNDTYVVDLIASGTSAKLQDIVTDTGGVDTLDVRSAGLPLAAPFTVVLATTLENLDLSLTGTDHLNATGNAAQNTLTGNAGDNTLDGVLNTTGGGDVLIGGAGNDTYILHSEADTVSETGGGGNDTVVLAMAESTTVATNFNISGYANVENMKVTGTGLFNLTGDANDNVLTGNGSANSITGGGGNDTIDGGIGHDTLSGGTGVDTFVYTKAEATAFNWDHITDFTAGPGGDVINLHSVLSGSGVTPGTINNFVEIFDNTGNVDLTVKVGSSFVLVAKLDGHTVADFTDAATMYANGNLII